MFAPFPLLRNEKTAINHAKGLTKLLTKEVMPLGTAQTVLAKMYGFKQWKVFFASGAEIRTCKCHEKAGKHFSLSFIIDMEEWQMLAFKTCMSCLNKSGVDCLISNFAGIAYKYMP